MRFVREQRVAGSGRGLRRLADRPEPQGRSSGDQPPGFAAEDATAWMTMLPSKKTTNDG
jgi:hypothetical protein